MLAREGRSLSLLLLGALLPLVSGGGTSTTVRLGLKSSWGCSHLPDLTAHTDTQSEAKADSWQGCSLPYVHFWGFPAMHSTFPPHSLN